MSIIIFALLIIPAVSHANVPPPASLSDLFQIDCRNEQCEEHYQAKENYGTLSFEKSGNLVFQFPDGRTITLFEKKELKPVSQEVRKGLKGAAVIMTQPSEGQVELRGVDIDTHQFLELLIIQMNGE